MGVGKRCYVEWIEKAGGELKRLKCSVKIYWLVVREMVKSIYPHAQFEMMQMSSDTRLRWRVRSHFYVVSCSLEFILSGLGLLG